MSPKVQIAILGSAIACLAIGLAASVAIRNEIMANRQRAPETLGKTDFVHSLSADLDDVLSRKPTSTAALTAANCTQAGGRWNECGSLCRGKPAGTVCAEVCVPQCECTVGEKQCPAGYGCASDLPAGEGVCRPGEGGGKIPVPPSKPVHEFKSADGVTSVVLAEPKLGNPFTFSGTTTAFENVFSWRLRQADGKIVASGTGYANSPDVGKPGGFSIKGFFDLIPTAASGTLEVYEASAKDGTPLHRVDIPVELPTGKVKIFVYWGNSKKNPNATDCSLVYPVGHEIAAPGSDDPKGVAAAIHELLKGPTKWERSQGYYTSLPLTVKDPVFTLYGLEFGQDLQEGVGGSCRVAGIRAQINATYTQHDKGVADPVISIDGRTEDILQP